MTLEFSYDFIDVFVGHKIQILVITKSAVTFIKFY